jgi:hypothetical protein
MTKLQELRTELHVAKAAFERLSHVGGDAFVEAGRDMHAVHDAYMDEMRREYGMPLYVGSGMHPLSGPHEHTHKRFPPIVSCHEFERGRARTAMIYLRWFACAIATVVGTVLVVAFLLYAAGA